jgi:indolepyruvate ferredoxin oxidoreductase, beta subunit
VTYDVLLCGVGGQGVLSMASLIGQAALARGLEAKQSEVHGMAQRGGAVCAHLRLSNRSIASDLIPRGAADLILGLEPLECLRYVEYLDPRGAVVTAVEPVRNISDYPSLDQVLARLRTLPRARLVEAERLARQAGDPVAVNTVMVGAAADLLPFEPEQIVGAIERRFARKGEWALRVNRLAFEAGQAATRAPRAAAIRG